MEVQIHKFIKSQTAQRSTGLLQKIFYTWGLPALLKLWECFLWSTKPGINLVFLLLYFICLHGWWDSGGAREVSERGCTLWGLPPVSVRSVDDSGMRGDGCGCVHKAGKMNWGASPFSICPSLNPCHRCDGQALKQAGGHFAAGGNREQSVTSHYREQTDRLGDPSQICDPVTCWAGNGTEKTGLSGMKSFKQQVDRCEYCSWGREEIAGGAVICRGRLPW